MLFDSNTDSPEEHQPMAAPGSADGEYFCRDCEDYHS